MKLAVLSDIHSNYIALEACIDFLEHHKVNQILFLGDSISDCPKPQITLNLLRELDSRYPTFHIRGNREEYFIDHEDGLSDDWSYSSYKGSLLYTYEHLKHEDITEFRRRPNHTVLKFDGMADIQLVHGSPHSSRELLKYEGKNTKTYLKQMPTDYLLSGHTHRQFTYCYRGKTLINPGSVGVAIGMPKAAHFAVLEWKHKEWQSSLITVPFDYEKVKKFFYESSLMEKARIWPLCILKSMETGVNMGPLCAKTAYDMAVAAKDKMEYGTVPEKYWERAAKRLEVI